MQHYYRVKRANGLVATLHTYCDWDKVVVEYGDDLIGEVNGRGVFQRFNIPTVIRKKIDDLLLSMNENNILEVNQKITDLHDSVVQAAMSKPEKTLIPDYLEWRDNLTSIHQNYYNNVIIPPLFPEEKCKVCESPMFHRVFADLFFPERGTDQVNIGYHPKDADPQVLPEIVKVVDGKHVVDTDALDERSRRMQFARAALEPLTVKTPEEVGISIPLKHSELAIQIKAPSIADIYLATTKSQEVVDQICTAMYGKDWRLLRTNVNPPEKQKTAYELWLEDGNVGEIDDFVYECSRKLRYTSLHPEGFKETVKYFRKPGGHTVVIRKDNHGGYALDVTPTKTGVPFELPEIKGVVLKGSKIPVEVADREINSKIVEFVEAQFPEHIQKEVLSKVLPDVYSTEEKKVEEVIPSHLKRILDNIKFSKGHIEAAMIGFKELISGSKPEAAAMEKEAVADAVRMMVDMASNQVHADEDIVEILKREESRRLLININVYDIHEQFLKFLVRCDEEQLNTTTPSSYDREHFDKIYAANRCAIGSQIGAVLTPHLEFQGAYRSFMVDATEDNVFRVLRQARETYRPLATVRFKKGFFNIEMH